MRFDYVPYAGHWLPLVPVTFSFDGHRLPAVSSLVDTGATQTILPAEMAAELGIDLDLESQIETEVAGGGLCSIYPSPAPIRYQITEPLTGVPCAWDGLAYFALGQQFILLGHDQCLERFDVTFWGPDRCLDIVPHFRRDSRA